MTPMPSMSANTTPPSTAEPAIILGPERMASSAPVSAPEVMELTGSSCNWRARSNCNGCSRLDAHLFSDCNHCAIDCAEHAAPRRELSACHRTSKANFANYVAHSLVCGRISIGAERVEDGAADEAHAKCAAQVIEDAIWTTTISISVESSANFARTTARVCIRPLWLLFALFVPQLKTLERL